MSTITFFYINLGIDIILQNPEYKIVWMNT